MNPVPWNKNRSKLSGFRSKPFRGRETSSVFRSEACLGPKQAANYVCWIRIFVKPIIFLSFRSVPSFGIDSSVKLGMPWNVHFLPRSNGIHPESIPRNFFGTKFRCQPQSQCVLEERWLLPPLARPHTISQLFPLAIQQRRNCIGLLVSQCPSGR